MIEFNLFLICNLIALMYVWFETDAFIEWGKLFKLKFLKYKEYDDIKSSSLSAIAGKNYCDFLLYKYPGHFLVKLITCPTCLSVWVNILAVCVFNSGVLVKTLGFNIIITWVLFNMLRWSLQKLNA